MVVIALIVSSCGPSGSGDGGLPGTQSNLRLPTPNEPRPSGGPLTYFGDITPKGCWEDYGPFSVPPPENGAASLMACQATGILLARLFLVLPTE